MPKSPTLFFLAMYRKREDCGLVREATENYDIEMSDNGQEKQAETESELRKLPRYDEFAANDLRVLEELEWKRAAYHVWHDAVYDDPKHSQKWAGMISARLLKNISDDSRAVTKLTRVLVFQNYMIIILTLVIFGDALLRLFGHK